MKSLKITKMWLFLFQNVTLSLLIFNLLLVFLSVKFESKIVTHLNRNKTPISAQTLLIWAISCNTHIPLAYCHYCKNSSLNDQK